MSIRDRVEEAELLWNSGKKDGAWTLALIAAAATARKRYPRPMPDNESFKSFIRDVTPIILYGDATNQDFKGQLSFAGELFGDIMYRELQCALVHEAEKTSAVVFSPAVVKDGVVTSTLGVGVPKQIPEVWALHVLQAVRLARENADEFSPEPTRGFPGGQQ